MFILHGHAYSKSLARVVFCLLEMGLEDGKDFRIEPLDWEDIRGDDWALQHQPFKQMPYMVDDEAGIEVYESRSIIKYIAMRVKSTLHVMGDINQVVRYQTACDVELANFTIFAEQLTFECLYKEIFTGVPPDPTLVAFLSRMLDTRLTGYERLLSQQPYLAGQELTLADLFHVPNALAMLEAGHVQAFINADGKSPNVAGWWAEISSRASWTKVAGILGRIPT